MRFRTFTGHPARLGFTACLVLVLHGSGLHAQTTLNPDISLIGDIRGGWHNDSNRPDEEDAFNLDLHEAELAIQGYLNPYARADIFFGWHEETAAEIEELYFTLSRGLPLSMAVRAGRYLLPVGKINQTHPHAYSFIERPLSNLEFFGEEGLADVGIELSLPIPTGPLATTLAASVLKGDFLEGEEHAHALAAQDEPSGEERPNERAFGGRIETFVPTSEYGGLGIGLAGVTGVPHEDERRYIGGFDLKYRWKPDRYRSFTAGAEWLVNRAPLEHEEEENITSHGFFGYVDHQFRQRYNVGAAGSWVQSAENSDDQLWRIGGFAGYAPVEETSLLRLLVSYEKDVSADHGFWSAALQLVFSLGPHQPHMF
ncbi:MAG: hypothetical protein AB1752_08560 [Candidatus Zixiibacteriota bacterium]